MEITEDEVMTAESDQEDKEDLKEVWSIPREDNIREFEEYLMEIGLRI